MAPGIGRSISEGFQAAKKSWAVMGIFAAGWLVVGSLVALAVGMTGVPEEAFTLPELPAPTTQPTSPAPPLQPTEQAATTDSGTQTPAADTDQPPAPSPEKRLAEQEQAIAEWLGRAWPILLLCACFFIAANVWLTGAQIGYLAKRVISQQARLADFWTSGTQAFVGLLGGTFLSFGLIVIIGLAILLVALLLSALAGVLPGAVSGVLGFLLGLAVLIGLIWLGVRFVLWFIAIVVDRLGPVAGLKASLGATRGRWWSVFGLLMVAVAISAGIAAATGLMGWAGNAIGGGIAAVIGFLMTLVRIVANLMLGFTMMAALIRFYADAKPGSTASETPAVP